MKKYIVDASIILKWVLEKENEPDHDKAAGLLHTWVSGVVGIAAPGLWTYEVANILGRALPDEADQKMKLLLDLKIEAVDCSEQMFRQCFTWMKEHQVTFYDAVYLAAAYAIDAVLLTSDEKFREKMKNDSRICPLKDLN
ncbi:MAG: type II toxin-antitoxin system VapC family toxin [Syntrophales bacterium]|jgi:predicted nucleic acid-binding protein|nr:type II toxin-antitoxin system VapC family toxin [Syntrophales bacterium]